MSSANSSSDPVATASINVQVQNKETEKDQQVAPSFGTADESCSTEMYILDSSASVNLDMDDPKSFNGSRSTLSKGDLDIQDDAL